MTDIARLSDADGAVHYTARGSQRYERLIRDGARDLDNTPADITPTVDPEVVTDAAPSGQGDDHDTGTTGGGSGKRQRTTRTTGGGDAPAGEVQSSPGS